MMNNITTIKDYTTYSNEELVTMIRCGDPDGNEVDDAYAQLFHNLRPVILHEAGMYRHKMDYYDNDDFLQEGYILLWKTINKNNYQVGSGRFSTYFGVAYCRELIRIYERYCMKNLICIDDSEDYHGATTRVLVVSEYAKKQRELKNARQRRYLERKRIKEGKPPVPEKKEPLSREEKNRRKREYRKRYYAEHPEKLEERREKNRIRERERQRRIRAEKKAQKMAASSSSL